MNVGICKYNGGGMNQLPHAVPDDGLLAVTVINDIGKIRILANLYRVFNGTLLEHPGVEGYQAKSDGGVSKERTCGTGWRIFLDEEDIIFCRSQSTEGSGEK